MAQQHTSQDVRHCMQEALSACEKLLEEKNPITSYEPIAEMTRCLVKLRDQLISEQRDGASLRPRLDRVNSIVSLAASTEYPLVGVRWDRFCMMRDALRDLLQEMQAKDDSASATAG